EQQRKRSPGRNGSAGIRMKMSLSPEQQVRTTTTTEQDAPLKHSVQAAGSKTGKRLSELLRGTEATLPGSADHIEIQQGTCDSRERKSTRLNSSHVAISYAVFCLKKNM